MALFRRNTRDKDRMYLGDREHTERVGTSPGLVRALFTLLGVGVAGLLIWIAQAISGALDGASTSDFWWAMLFLAAAGLALGLSQLFGGWTKWGWPTLSPTVFLLGFLPTLIVGGWILLTEQPTGGWQQSRFEGWTDDIGLAGLVNDLATFLPVIPLIVGLVLAFSFDTTGPRRRVTAPGPTAADEVVTARRDRELARTETTREAGTTTSSGSTVAEDLRRGDGEGEQPVRTGARAERLDERDRRDTT
jgi:hypothetical protein